MGCAPVEVEGCLAQGPNGVGMEAAYPFLLRRSLAQTTFIHITCRAAGADGHHRHAADQGPAGKGRRSGTGKWYGNAVRKCEEAV